MVIVTNQGIELCFKYQKRIQKEWYRKSSELPLFLICVFRRIVLTCIKYKLSSLVNT